MKSVLDFQKQKQAGEKISMVTCYDYTSARALNKSTIDALLVGDSVAMVIHGYPSTVHATGEMMATHTAAVVRGAGDKFVVADMPFLSYRQGRKAALALVAKLMRAGAQAVKLEGVRGHESAIETIVQSGVPVMGHIGLTPQSIHGLGGFRVQGRDEGTAKELLLQAKKLEDLGCFALVLECIPSDLARTISQSLRIPTVGIGAGAHVDGQILVLQDLLGMNSEFQPKFLRKFATGEEWLKEAVNRYREEVSALRFPNLEESYS